MRVSWGWRRFPKGDRLDRHRHAVPHLALVLAGGYEESGDDGRWRVEPGDIIAHAPFGGHANRIDKHTRVLRLPVPARPIPWRRARCHDADRIARLAETSLSEAAALAVDSSVATDTPFLDWPDMLAHRLAYDSEISIVEWAREQGVAREHLSREFRLLYLVSSAVRAAPGRRSSELMSLSLRSPPQPGFPIMRI